MVGEKYFFTRLNSEYMRLIYSFRNSTDATKVSFDVFEMIRTDINGTMKDFNRTLTLLNATVNATSLN